MRLDLEFPPNDKMENLLQKASKDINIYVTGLFDTEGTFLESEALPKKLNILNIETPWPRDWDSNPRWTGLLDLPTRTPTTVGLQVEYQGVAWDAQTQSVFPINKCVQLFSAKTSGYFIGSSIIK